ncbi:transposable element Tc3 transposase [Trichonephila clavipes]|nr:transposable element Tc3 transposase [Trichonephila clavipes]
MLNGWTELHVFDRGSVIRHRYYKEVILLHVPLFCGAVAPGLFIMGVNAQPHRTADIQQLLKREDLTRRDWQAFSPDLNSVEHVYDALGRHLAARLHPPGNSQHLKQILIEEWAYPYLKNCWTVWC